MTRRDPGLPGAGPRLGGPHPVPATVGLVAGAFRPLGFEVLDLPLLAAEADNFDLLGYPADHPTRTQLTFFPADGVVLRTHASSGVLPLLRRSAPGPVRALLVGTCFRNEKASAYSAAQFTQIDGVVVQPGLGLPDLLGLAGVLVGGVFGAEHPWWLVRSGYPFTAPGFALEITCPLCTGGCEECQDRGRIEIGSAGLLSREVLAAGGYPAGTTGVSFGCSVERLLRLTRGLTDIRVLLANDPAVLAQFD
ncbi:strongly similar to phenylalanyl-tRNA synthetase alpha chain [Actinoplanes sp. N902-109]|nr:strongly similar to phenylalanyl-tRNA synthetase alpha chain [Actinoplanes sp. N902-109]